MRTVILKGDTVCAENEDKSLTVLGKTIPDYPNYPDYPADREISENHRDEDMRVPICFDYSGFTLVWDHDEKEHNAEKLRSNNLFIIKDGRIVWNMRMLTGHDDSCVLVRRVSDSSFYFGVFGGTGMTVEVGDEIRCVNKTFTK